MANDFGQYANLGLNSSQLLWGLFIALLMYAGPALIALLILRKNERTSASKTSDQEIPSGQKRRAA